MTGRVKREEPCSHEDCGSRRFHVGDDGYTYCDRGHQQSERGTVVTEDTGELIIHGKTSKRKGDSDGESTASRATGFKGARALEHYLLCLQLVLRKQTKWLIEVKQLPAEIEVLIRDLWAFRLQSLEHRTSTGDSVTDADGRSQSQSQLFSSQSEGESSDQSHRRTLGRNDSRKEPKLIETLGLIYTASLLMRIPLTIGDLHTWVQNGELLFTRTAQEIPLQMREKLPAIFQEHLEPQNLGSPSKLHRITLSLLEKLSTVPGMAFPGINYPLVLYRWIRSLGLPIEIFTASQRLSRFLNVDFSYGLEDRAIERLRVLRYPEARLMALVVISTKLLFPFDDAKHRRIATSATDLSALTMDWTSWAKTYTTSPSEPSSQEQPLSFHEAEKMTELEAASLSGDKLDAYLDMYESTFASEDVRSYGEAGREADFRRALFRFFPTERDTDSAHGTSTEGADSQGERLRQTQARLQPRRIARDPAPENSIGSAYRRFRSAEELLQDSREDGTVEAQFYQLAARLAGVDIEDMVRAVFALERRMQVREEEMRSQRG